MTDPKVYNSKPPKKITGAFDVNPLQSDVLALIAASVADPDLRVEFDCLAGLNVGDPVYLSADLTATLAQADTFPHSLIFGFVRSKRITTKCYIQFFRRVTGLTGGTAGAPIYLTDAGGYSATPGTLKRIAGRFLDSTTGILFANPSEAYHPKGSRYKTAAETLTNNTLTTLTLDTTAYDHDVATMMGTANAVRPQTVGQYMVTGQAKFVGNTTGVRRLSIALGGAGIATMEVPGIATDHYLQVSAVVTNASSGDLTLRAYQNSGGNLDISEKNLTLIRLGD